MRSQWKRFVLGMLLGLGCTPALFAQIPGAAAPGAAGAAAPGAAGAAAPGAAGAAAPGAAPAAAPNNIWSKLCMTPEQKAACRDWFCNSPFGKIYSSMLLPVSAFSGGLITDCCARPSLTDLAQPADSADGAAARIKQDELEAKARRAAVRYLGTVDCSRWPEAEAALILSVRGDRNECVRLEAAWVLGRGCCCTPKVVAALSLVVAGSDRDGMPVERSERVKAAAAASLDHCLNCLAPTVPVLLAPPPAVIKEKVKQKIEVAPPGPEVPPPPDGVTRADHKAAASGDAKKLIPEPTIPLLKFVAFYEQVTTYENVAPLVQQARKQMPQARTSPAMTTCQNRHGGLIHIVSQAFNSAPSASDITSQEVIQTSGTELMPLSAYQPTTVQTSGSTIYLPPPVAPSMGNVAPANRGLIPALFNRSPGPQSMPMSTESFGAPTISTGQAPTTWRSTNAPGATSHYAPSVTPVAPAALGTPITCPPPAATSGARLEVTPMSIDQILASTGTSGR
jgi:hypothetical protein